MEVHVDSFYDWLSYVWPYIAMIVALATLLLILVSGGLDRDA